MAKPVQILIAVLCLGGAGYLIFNFMSKPSPTANEGTPDFLHFKCGNPECGLGYSWERGTDTGGRDIDTCPDCGTIEAFRAAKCQECGHYQAMAGHGSYEKICPECGADIPPIREQR
ncbi:MAG: hypothetical protein ACF8R9_01060 [Phycisphaerales bacterium JB054]